MDAPFSPFRQIIKRSELMSLYDVAQRLLANRIITANTARMQKVRTYRPILNIRFVQKLAHQTRWRTGSGDRLRQEHKEKPWPFCGCRASSQSPRCRLPSLSDGRRQLVLAKRQTSRARWFDEKSGSKGLRSVPTIA